MKMMSRNTSFRLIPAALSVLCLASASFGAEEQTSIRGAGPADPPSWYRGDASPMEMPSVVEGTPAGIEVGDFAPDFELQPIQPYADLQKWLGDDAPESVEENVVLSQFVGKAPIILLFGSYT